MIRLVASSTTPSKPSSTQVRAAAVDHLQGGSPRTCKVRQVSERVRGRLRGRPAPRRVRREVRRRDRVPRSTTGGRTPRSSDLIRAGGLTGLADAAWSRAAFEGADHVAPERASTPPRPSAPGGPRSGLDTPRGVGPAQVARSISRETVNGAFFAAQGLSFDRRMVCLGSLGTLLNCYLNLRR